MLKRPGHGRVIAPNALGKAQQIRQTSLFGFQQPGIQGVAITLPHQCHERCHMLLYRLQIGAPLVQRR